jgi:hypothetical protein
MTAGIRWAVPEAAKVQVLPAEANASSACLSLDPERHWMVSRLLYSGNRMTRALLELDPPGSGTAIVLSALLNTTYRSLGWTV